MNNKKIAIVTGGARGIGRAIVYQLCDAGYFVIFTYINSSEKAQNMVDELGSDKSMFYKADVKNYSEMKSMVDSIIDQFGQVDVLINNAGITHDKSMMMMEISEWEDVINTNLTGAFMTTKAVIIPMLKAKFGRIVFISSVTGLTGAKGQVNYAASKAGLIGMTKALAKETASYGITVNAIAPGFIETDMLDTLNDDYAKTMKSLIPCGKFGKVDDVAKLVAFVVSDAGNYITGEVIRIDGGLAM